jgi:hypothetical protein
MAIPIVDEEAMVVGWTDTPPEVRAGQLFHPDAERLIGAHYASYVEIHDRQYAIRAGAPANWRSPWRCLGLCSGKLMRQQSASQVPLIRVFPSRSAGSGRGSAGSVNVAASDRVRLSP